MSNQESMYYPPEQRPDEQRQYNNDPYEQPQASYEAYAPEQSAQEQERAYQEGYNGAAAYRVPNYGQGARTYAPPPPFPTRQFSPWQIVLLIVGLIIIVNGIGGLFSRSGSGAFFGLLGVAVIVFAIAKWGYDRATPLPPQEFMVSEQATLRIHNPAGPIRVQRGEGDKVVVQAVKHISSVLGKYEDMVLDCQQDGDTISINSRNIATRGIKSGHMDLNIFVPENCDLHIDDNAGSVRIEGIRGLANVKTNAGLIRVDQSTLAAGTSLRTNAGSLHLQQVKLEGNTNLETNAGTIHFEGELSGAHDYRMHTNAGTVHVELPRSSSFTLQAKTDVGTITNDFGSNSVGSEPQARLSLRSNLGTITVRSV